VNIFAGQASSEPLRHFALLYSIDVHLDHADRFRRDDLAALLRTEPVLPALQPHSESRLFGDARRRTLIWEGRRAGPVGAAKRITARPRSGSSP
jgi:hypothetical protein